MRTKPAPRRRAAARKRLFLIILSPKNSARGTTHSINAAVAVAPRRGQQRCALPLRPARDRRHDGQRRAHGVVARAERGARRRGAGRLPRGLGRRRRGPRGDGAARAARRAGVLRGGRGCYAAHDLHVLYPWLAAFADAQDPTEGPATVFGRAYANAAARGGAPRHATHLTAKAHFIFRKVAAIRHAAEAGARDASVDVVAWADADIELVAPLADARFLAFARAHDVATIHRYVVPSRADYPRDGDAAACLAPRDFFAANRSQRALPDTGFLTLALRGGAAAPALASRARLERLLRDVVRGAVALPQRHLRLRPRPLPDGGDGGRRPAGRARRRGAARSSRRAGAGGRARRRPPRRRRRLQATRSRRPPPRRSCRQPRRRRRRAARAPRSTARSRPRARRPPRRRRGLVRALRRGPARARAPPPAGAGRARRRRAGRRRRPAARARRSPRATASTSAARTRAPARRRGRRRSTSSRTRCTPRAARTSATGARRTTGAVSRPRAAWPPTRRGGGARSARRRSRTRSTRAA